MSYALRPDQPIDQEIRRIAIERIDHGIRWSGRSGSDPYQAVHEVRKDCKRVRGLIRLIRPEAPDLYTTENAAFRDAARSLSTLRDAEAAIETYDALSERFAADVDRRSLRPIRLALERHRARLAEDEEALADSLESVRHAMEQARERAQGWELPAAKSLETGFDLLGGGLAKTYARGRKAMARADETSTVESFHEWRKRAKYLRYHLRLLRPAWPKLLKPARGEAKRLSDLLGDDHDLAVLRETLPKAMVDEQDSERIERFLALVERRGRELREQARWLGARLYAEKPKAFRKRMGRYWTAAARESVSSGRD